jgi:hypothetical protein
MAGTEEKRTDEARRKVCQADVPAFRCAAVWALPAH